MATLVTLQVVQDLLADLRKAAEDAREVRGEAERTVIGTGPGLAAESAAEQEGLMRIQRSSQREIA